MRVVDNALFPEKNYIQAPKEYPKNCVADGALFDEPSTNKVNPSIVSAINNWGLYHFHNTELTSPLRRAWEVRDNAVLHNDGSNLAPFIMHLRGEHPDSYQILRETIQFILPSFSDFVFKPQGYGNGQTMVDLRWQNINSDYVMQNYHLSDGTLRLIALTACLIQPIPPSTIIIDEPELGLHPYAISSFAEDVKHSEQKSQVIISTQSPLLVDEFSPADIVTVNHEDGESKFNRLSEADLSEWLKAYSLGELWLSNVIAASP